MSEDAHYLIGLMSGTSIDGIDAALINTKQGIFSLSGHHSIDFTAECRNEILKLCAPGNNEIQRMGTLDRQLGEAFARCCNELLQKFGIPPQKVRAIGSHGQTIRHHPQGINGPGFTCQIGDPNTIAELTGITTVADFRRRDIAAGGEGAPLVPAFHQAVFTSPTANRAVINIGGMANISVLQRDGSYSGFDTGPGNVLMDSWIQEHLNQPYDENGQWSLTGQVDTELLHQLMNHPFIKALPPKSTGRETFNLSFLQDTLANINTNANAADVQATLLAFTAQSIAEAVQLHASDCSEIYICGGGANNTALKNSLSEKLPDCSVASTEALGIPPQWVEASAFAWLAQQTLDKRPGNAPSVTGAKKPVILGGIYCA